MGGARKSEFFRSCPVGTVLKETEIVLYLAAYNIFRAFGDWPPGRRDPRVMEAFAIIQDEHSRVDLEIASRGATK